MMVYARGRCSGHPNICWLSIRGRPSCWMIKGMHPLLKAGDFQQSINNFFSPFHSSFQPHHHHGMHPWKSECRNGPQASHGRSELEMTARTRDKSPPGWSLGLSLGGLTVLHAWNEMETCSLASWHCSRSAHHIANGSPDSPRNPLPVPWSLDCKWWTTNDRLIPGICLGSLSMICQSVPVSLSILSNKKLPRILSHCNPRKCCQR